MPCQEHHAECVESDLGAPRRAGEVGAVGETVQGDGIDSDSGVSQGEAFR